MSADRTLTAQQRKTILAWIEQQVGAKGKEADIFLNNLLKGRTNKRQTVENHLRLAEFIHGYTGEPIPKVVVYKKDKGA